MFFARIRTLTIGLLVSLLIGCNEQGVAVPIPSSSASIGQPTWPCSMHIFLPGTIEPYDGAGICGAENPPVGSSICEVALPSGGKERGWCLPTPNTVPSSTPVPIIPSSPSPQPLPSANAIPSISPSPFTPPSPGSSSILQANPSIVTLISASQPSQTIVLSEPGYAGQFFATSSNPSIVSVSPASGTGPFTVTEVGGGSALIIFSDSQGNSTTVPVAAD